MTQYTKFTKNISYNENYSNLPTTNGGLNTPLNHNLTKTSSRGSNMTGLSANGSPALTLNANLPKPVLITNLNSSNISSLIKNERIKSSTIARSVTMRYNTNTKLQFENAYNTSNNTSNANSGLINNVSSNNNNTSNLNGTANNLNGSNQSIQANHFHYNRRSLQQHGSPPQQQSSASTNNHQSHLSVDSSSNQQAKKEYLSLLSNIHRSQSIKLNRDKSNLSGYFSGLVSNRDSKQVNCSTLNNTSTNLSNLTSNSNNLGNSGANAAGSNNQINYIQLNTNKYNRKHQPFSLRNNAYNTNTNNNNNNNNSNNSINLAGSNDGNYLLNNTNNINYNSNGLLNSKHANNSSNNRLSEISKNSISLDNVYNGLDLIIANEHRSNKSNTNLGINAYTSNLKKSTTSNSNQHYATTTTTTQSSNNSNPNYPNYSNTNYLIDNSNRIINEFNLLKSNQISNTNMNNKKRIQKLDMDDEITHTTMNNNNNNMTLNNMTQEDQMISKDLSSSRSNHLKLNGEASNENDENNNLDETTDYTSKLHTHNGLSTTNSINENSLLKASNYFAKKVKPSKSEMRHAKINDEQIYGATANSKLNKLDLMDQLELYHQKPSNSINYLKAAAAVTKPLMTNASSGMLQSSAHSPTNNRYLNNKTDMQRERTLIDYNNYTASNNMNMNSNMNNSSKNLNNTTLESQSKLNYSRSQLTRNHSRLSHITRDVNDSYAYTNVQQYIEENELMPPEKAHSIRKWIIEVNNSYEEWEKKTVEKHIEDSFI